MRNRLFEKYRSAVLERTSRLKARRATMVLASFALVLAACNAEIVDPETGESQPVDIDSVLAVEVDGEELTIGTIKDNGADGSTTSALPGQSDKTTSDTAKGDKSEDSADDKMAPSTTAETSGDQTGDSMAPEPDRPPIAAGGFREGFDGNTGLDNLTVGVYHRDSGTQILGEPANIWGDNNALKRHGGSWGGDHGLDCGMPEEQRPLSSSGDDFNLDEVAYMCMDHLMTSMGDVAFFSMLWFSPKASFSSNDVSTISWDVNVTDLGNRQWWEVVILPTGTEFPRRDSGNGPTNMALLGSEAIIVGKAGQDGVTLKSQGQDQYNDWRRVCAYDPEGCESIRPRRPFSITDNKNGTLTVDYGGMFTQDMPGTLPDQFEVFFTDQNYTPDKDGIPIGHTWHWDNIEVS